MKVYSWKILQQLNLFLKMRFLFLNHLRDRVNALANLFINTTPQAAELRGTDPDLCALGSALTLPLLLAGDRVPAGELERAGPGRLRRAGSGGVLQGAQSEEGESLFPVR